MELLPVIELLRQKQSLFHSEADFQFALAWEIQLSYPTAEIRLEYPPVNEPNRYIDIFVNNKGFAHPIELKYKTKKLFTLVGGEQYNLKNHGVQDIGTYDFVKDLLSAPAHRSYFSLEGNSELKKSEFNRKQHFLVVVNGLDQKTVEALLYWKKNGFNIGGSGKATY